MDNSPLPENNGANGGILEELMYNVDALLYDCENVQSDESDIDMETMDALLNSESNCSEITEIDSMFDDTNPGTNCVQKNNETLDDVMNDFNTFLKGQNEGLEENHFPSSEAYVLSDMEDDLEMLLGNTAFGEGESFETVSETDNDITKRVFLKARRSLKPHQRSPYYGFNMSSDLSPVKQDVISNRLHFFQNPKLDNMLDFAVSLDSTQSRHIHSHNDCLQYPVTDSPESATGSGTHDSGLEKTADGSCGPHYIGAELTEFDNDIRVTIGTTDDRGYSPQQLDEDDFLDLDDFGVLKSINREYLRVTCNVFNSPDRVVNYTQAESQSQTRNEEHADVLDQSEDTSTIKTPPKTALLPQTSTPTYKPFQNKEFGVTPLASMKPHINIINISRISSHLSSTCQVNADSCSEDKFQVVPERNSSAFEKAKEMISVSDSDEKLDLSTPSAPKELTAQWGKREENTADATKLVPEENPNPSNMPLDSLEIISAEFLSSGDSLLTGLKIESENGLCQRLNISNADTKTEVDNSAVSVHTNEIESQNLHICDLDREITSIKPLSCDNQNVVDLEPHISNSQMTKVEHKSQVELSEYSHEENDDDNFDSSEYIVIDETFDSPVKKEKNQPNRADVTDILVTDMSISTVDASDDYGNQQLDELNTGTKPYLIDLLACQSNLELLAPTKPADSASELKTNIAIESEKSDERSEEKNPITCTNPYLTDLSAFQSNLELAPTQPSDSASELNTNIAIESKFKIIADSDKHTKESVETKNVTEAKAVEEKLNTVAEIDSGYIEGDSKLSRTSVKAEPRGEKRHISDISNSEAAPKKIKSAKPPTPDVTQDEERDNTDPRWKLHEIQTPKEGFDLVCKQWRSNPLPRPHDDLTMRWVRQQNNRVRLWKDQSRGRPSHNKYECHTVEEIYRQYENDIHNEIRESQNNLFFHMRPQGCVRTINTLKSHLGYLYEVLPAVQAVYPEVSNFYQFYDHGLMTQRQMDDGLFQQEILNNITHFYSYE